MSLLWAKKLCFWATKLSCWDFLSLIRAKEFFFYFSGSGCGSCETSGWPRGLQVLGRQVCVGGRPLPSHSTFFLRIGWGEKNWLDNSWDFHRIDQSYEFYVLMFLQAKCIFIRSTSLRIQVFLTSVVLVVEFNPISIFKYSCWWAWEDSILVYLGIIGHHRSPVSGGTKLNLVTSVVRIFRAWLNRTCWL